MLCAAGLSALAQSPPRRNILIFVADGLRHGSVNEQDTPALWAIRTEGVHFENSHALFPTFTMAISAAIATGRGLGDTGAYSNVLWALRDIRYGQLQCGSRHTGAVHRERSGARRF